MSSRQRILVDCDPGIDDAFALMCALRFADLAAVTTVSGNVSIDNTTRNARYLLDMAGADIPVHRGAGSPMFAPAVAADYIHGSSGLGDLTVTDPSTSESTVSAHDAIVEFCNGGDAVIVATGPLTNIAIALADDPTLVERIRHLYWMGGSTTVGNVTERAEFNAWADPHAVDITMRSGVPLTMYGLNLTHQVRMGAPEIETLRGAGSPTAELLGNLLAFYHQHGSGDSQGQPVHDTCAVLGATHPELFETSGSNIVAHVSDERRGETEVSGAKSGGEEPVTTHRVATVAASADVIDLVLTAAIEPRATS